MSSTKNRFRVDLLSAIVAGFCAGTCISVVDALDHPIKPSAYAWSLGLASVAYLVASLSHLIGREAARRVVPSWLMIAILGSVLFVAMDLGPAVIGGWAHPQRIEQSLLKYFSNELKAAGFVVLFLTLITMPITALVYYAADIVRGAKAWHDGPGTSSIFPKPRS